MVLFVKVDKDGLLSEENLDNINNLYKKCNLRKQEGFNKLYNYKYNTLELELWGRNEGRNNIKNKFIFEFDKSINLYGSCGIILKKGDNLQDITVAEYNTICSNFKNQEKNIVIEKEKPNIKDTINNIDIDNSDSDDDDSDDSSDESFSDSELEPDDYIYSSEED